MNDDEIDDMLRAGIQNLVEIAVAEANSGNSDTAIHEAGHIIVAHYHRFLVTHVDMKPNLFGTRGPTHYRAMVRTKSVWPDDLPTDHIAWLRAKTDACVSIAGAAAVHLFGEGNEAQGVDGDLWHIVSIIKHHHPTMTAARERRYLNGIWGQACRILEENEANLWALVAQLRQNSTLTPEDLRPILDRITQRKLGQIDKHRNWMEEYGEG